MAWASCLADLLESMCYLTAELEAVDGNFDTPILQSRLAANDQPKQRAEAQDRLKACLIRTIHNPHPAWQVLWAEPWKGVQDRPKSSESPAVNLLRTRISSFRHSGDEPGCPIRTMTLRRFPQGYVSNSIRTRNGTAFKIRYCVPAPGEKLKHSSETLYGLEGKKAARAVLEERIKNAAKIESTDMILTEFVNTFWKPYLDRKDLKPATRSGHRSIIDYHLYTHTSTKAQREASEILK